MQSLKIQKFSYNKRILMIDSKSFSIRLEQHLIKIYSEVKTSKEIKQLSNDLQKFVESKVNKLSLIHI